MRRRRHLSRILLNAGTILSLVLFMATAVLWASSYPVGDEPLDVGTPTPTPALVVSSFRGDVGVAMYTYFDLQPERTTYIRTHWNELDEGSLSIRRTAQFLFVGVADEVVRSRSGAAVSRRRAIFVPHWLVLALAGLLPLSRCLRLARAGLHRPQGQCASCGYDLRATPDRCPECGVAPAPPPPPPA